MALEHVVIDIEAHVDTVIVWGMKEVYAKTTLKSKDATNCYRVNRFGLIKIKPKKFSNVALI